jgi:hypothetical protein
MSRRAIVLSRGMSALAKAHRALAFVIVAAIPIQFFLAGLGAFGAADWGFHALLGLLVVLLGLIVLVFAAISRRLLKPSAILFGLLVLQFLLVMPFRESAPAVSALHPVNALLVLGAAVWTARGQLGPGPLGAVGAGDSAVGSGSAGREREGASARVR